ncbi:glycosyltransferase family 2 protein [Membranihabitans marinus]|uniref:glycosyltransferase family 2 protein n=1 Tax=Membranihabitans marinus TaxID=1227546 RepID=UPI001F1EC2C2|nr:glycosyltransferase family 2 protein [Membranihabitans marinus]
MNLISQPNPNDEDKLAIVILNYNGRHHLEKYLPSVCQHKPDYARIYIADNASTDDSVDWLCEHYPELHILVLEENTGYAGGYNTALEVIEAEYYFLLNSDVEINANSIDPLVTFLDNHRDYGACQPKILSYNSPHEFEYAGACGGWIDSFGYPLCRGRILSYNEEDHGQYDDEQPVFWATGAALMIRNNEFHFIGGFDEDFFAHMEEIDLCWRLQRIGCRIGVIPSATVLHLGGGTLDYSSPRKTYLNFRNNLFLLFKNERGHVLIWLLFLRLILDGIAGLRFIALKDWKNFMSIINAHFAFYQNIPKLWRKRREFLKLFTDYGIEEHQALDGRYKGAIVWDYFILKKKKFSQLNIDETK